MRRKVGGGEVDGFVRFSLSLFARRVCYKSLSKIDYASVWMNAMEEQLGKKKRQTYTYTLYVYFAHIGSRNYLHPIMLFSSSLSFSPISLSLHSPSLSPGLLVTRQGMWLFVSSEVGERERERKSCWWRMRWWGSWGKEEGETARERGRGWGESEKIIGAFIGIRKEKRLYAKTMFILYVHTK